MSPNPIESDTSSLTAAKDETRDLLREILEELRNIGVRLTKHDERLKSLEKGETHETDEAESTPAKEPQIDHHVKSWTPILEEIQTAVPTPLTSEDVISVYENDLVGISLAKYDSNYYAPSRQVSIEEKETWSSLVGNLWKVPEDGRLPLRFQRRWLLHPDGVILPGSEHLSGQSYLERLSAEDSLIPSQQSFIVISDFFDNGKKVKYKLDKQWGSTPTDPAKFSATMPINCPSGPWRRIIRMRGLEYNSISLIRGSPGYRAGQQIVDDYRQCTRNTGRTLGWIRFHLTFYEIKGRPAPFDGQRYSYRSFGISNWRKGALHSDKREYWTRQHLASGSKQRLLCESAYAVAALSGYQQRFESPRDYWTLIELRPDDLPSQEDGREAILGYKCDVLQIVLAFAEKALTRIHSRWSDLLGYFDHIISEKHAFLDPERHDNLLSDDETFSRSKKYFWAITALKELDLSITDNLSQIVRLVDHQASEEVEEARKQELEDARSLLRNHYRKFEEIAVKLREKRQEAMDLRDGLFSASAVMESRAATRLGENVKLLTLVSIFFLPLSFCMSVWSVNTLFSLTSLSITATIVGLSTYFIVFNLDHIVHLYQDIYRAFLHHSVGPMKLDANHVWAERARDFEKFSNPRGAEHKPSDWRLLQYSLLRIFTPTRRFTRPATEPGLPPAEEARKTQNGESILKAASFWTRRRTRSSSLPTTK